MVLTGLPSKEPQKHLHIQLVCLLNIPLNSDFFLIRLLIEEQKLDNRIGSKAIFQQSHWQICLILMKWP